LRFEVQDPGNATLSVWQISANGTDLRQVHRAGIGSRIANGRYSVFPVTAVNAEELWTHEEQATLWRSGAGATRLTAGPLNFTAPAASRDGRKVFAIGRLVRGQLQRYDSAAGQFQPYLSGISADGVAFSPDGQWIAYTTFPDFTLWRIRIDGSQRQQLMFAPQRAYFPRWSPDGRSIAFTIGYPLGEKRWKTYILAAEGGIPQEVVAGDSDYASPSWSPDGSSLAVGGVPWMKNWAQDSTDIREYRFATRTAVKIPGSTGLWAPRWSPDGRYIVAETANSREFMLLDRASGNWSSLAKVKDWIGYFCWSHDGQYLYFNLANEQSIYRIRLSDRKMELALRVRDFHVPDTTGKWFGLAPDDSFLLLRDVSVCEVYALDLDMP
jgi:Tol biopolymer transport system component